ncbi:MAG TPA: thioredoxin family protein, partial [Saprospiraceae bacterium]|nr:thioredoxin family protein [Saprospiraceae bacterium]
MTNKYASFFFPFLLAPFFLFAQTGIRFEHEAPLADALQKAKTEGKIVFMDAYTTWCGPCKMMTARTFPDSAVGAYFNARFVNLKTDMEKGEGPSLALKYGVEYYPTLLFFNAAGQIVHKAVGFHNVEDFLKLAKTATDPNANLLALETRYRNGERSAALLRALTETKGAAYDPATGQLANDYLKTQTNLAGPENMDFIMRYVDDPFSEGFKSMQKNRKVYEAKYSQKEVKQKMDLVFEDYLQRHPNLQLGEVQRLYGVVYPEQGERLASNYRLTYYRQREDMKNFALSAVDHYTRFPSDDADELNEIAFLFAQNVSDPAMLQKAVEWSEKSISLHESSYNQDTLARLYLQLGKKK